jgi:Zn-finger nucleic acid-binding protein
MADAQAVRMTKNPLALASALRKIAGKYRGGSDAPSGFRMVFILNPESEGLDESEGFLADLFSTHPPVSRRIGRLLEWAKADASQLKDDAEPTVAPADAGDTVSSQAPRYSAYVGENWVGPYTFSQWLAMGQLRPDTWVCPSGGADVARAGDTTGLSQIFAPQVGAAVAGERCPLCRVSLVHQTYEGAPIRTCPFCSGTLLTSQVLDRIVARRSQTFAETQVQEALVWRKRQKEGSIKDAECGVAIHCPQCGQIMSKVFHLLMTRVVMDRCSYDGMVWLDGGELERIQILVEQSAKIFALR